MASFVSKEFNLLLAEKPGGLECTYRCSLPNLKEIKAARLIQALRGSQFPCIYDHAPFLDTFPITNIVFCRHDHAPFLELFPNP
eukprot:1157559-Pelagomonas_calceolata.AAC.6